MRTRLSHSRASALQANRPSGASPPAPAHAEVRRILRSPRLQPKLTIGAPDDAFEHEADQVADHVMRMPEPAVGAASAPPRVLGVCAQCREETQVRRAQDVNAPTPQTIVDDEQFARATGGPTVARKVADVAAPSEGGEVLSTAAARAVAQRGPGRPMSEDSRRFFEPRFGIDFSGVRIHDGPAAARSAQSLNARAFAFGSDIWLGSHEREGDRRLLAHELVHVVQQQRAPGAPAALRRYVRTNMVYLWDVYDAAGRDPAAVTDAQLRTTIEYEDYRRADLVWKFSDTVAIAALRRSMDLFVAGVRGRGPNYIRAGREARAAAHGIESIFVTELGFTGDHVITSVPSGLGGTKGARIDDPDGSSPVWTIGGTRNLVAYTRGTPPAMFARFSVVPPVAAPVSGVQVRALVDGTNVGQASGLQISGGAIESAAGGGRVTGIGGGGAIPGADVGDFDADFRFETSTDGGRIWFASGSARLRMIFTAATPSPPGGDLREDALDWGGLVISSAATAAADLRRLVKALVIYNPTVGMNPSFATSDAVMSVFTAPDQCDSQAFLLRYLALSFGIPADVVYFWCGTPTEKWRYRVHSSGWWGPTFQCDRPAEDLASFHPHFSFHALTDINGTLHDPSYDFAGLPGILESAPGATHQTGSRASFLATTTHRVNFTCPH